VADSIIFITKSNLLGKVRKTLHKASLVNLSIKGVQIITAAHLNPGEKYNINLLAPALACSMDIKATVVWCKQSGKKGADTAYRIGFKFGDMKKEMQDKLNDLESCCLKKK